MWGHTERPSTPNLYLLLSNYNFKILNTDSMQHIFQNQTSMSNIMLNWSCFNTTTGT